MVCDRIGRLWATRQLCVLWIIGIAIFMGNGGSLGAVYAGRFIAGLGVGQTVVVAPVYLAEIVSLMTRIDIGYPLTYLIGPCFYSWSLYLCLHRFCLSRYCFGILRQLRLRAEPW